MMQPMLRLLSIVLVFVLAACGSGDGAPTPGGPGTSSMTQGRFTLSFTVAQASLRSSDAITGTAQLALIAPGGATFSGPGTLIGFEFSEVGDPTQATIGIYQYGPDNTYTNVEYREGEL